MEEQRLFNNSTNTNNNININTINYNDNNNDDYIVHLNHLNNEIERMEDVIRVLDNETRITTPEEEIRRYIDQNDKRKRNFIDEETKDIKFYYKYDDKYSLYDTLLEEYLRYPPLNESNREPNNNYDIRVLEYLIDKTAESDGDKSLKLLIL